MTPDDALRGATILVVDDEPVNVELLEDILGLAGYTAVVGTTDPTTVADLYVARHPDLVLLDLLMPALDGFGVMQQLRDLRGADGYLPVLVLTADVTPATRQRALAAGASDFLTKPFDQTELLLRVRNLLATRLLYLRLAQQYRLVERLHHQDEALIQARDAAQSSLAHDLGQPLTVIRLSNEALRVVGGRLPAEHSAAIAQIVTTISHGVEQIEALTGELSDLARMQRGRPLDLNLGPVDLVKLVNAEVAAARATTNRHTIEVRAGDAALTGEWDGPRLARVVDNLLSNAIKYSPGGGRVVVSVEREADGARRWSVVQVQDHGVGIPAADLPRLFEPFYRGSNVLGRMPGTGIGLAGARHIVEQHGGSISVVSGEGQGTTVTVRLPLWDGG